MVRVIGAAAIVLVLVLPVMAQEEFPRIEMAMGYANMGFPTGFNGAIERHSGFVMQTGFNFTKAFGIDNFTGFYGLGNDTTLISNIIGGKAAWRSGGKVVPYGVAGIGAGYLTQGYYSASGTLFSTRIGAGVDVPLSDVMSLKFDVSRLHFGDLGSHVNFTTGIVFTLAN